MDHIKVINYNKYPIIFFFGGIILAINNIKNFIKNSYRPFFRIFIFIISVIMLLIAIGKILTVVSYGFQF